MCDVCVACSEMNIFFKNFFFFIFHFYYHFLSVVIVAGADDAERVMYVSVPADDERRESLRDEEFFQFFSDVERARRVSVPA